MALPRRRNKEKRKRRGHTVLERRAVLARSPIETPKTDFDGRLIEIRRPGSWLENEYLEEPTFEERLLSMRPSILLDQDDEGYNPDIGNDFDDITGIADPEDFI